MHGPFDFADLKTKRLTLRSPSVDKALDFFALASDLRVTEFLAWEPHKSIGESASTIDSLITAQRAQQGFHWFVFWGDDLAGLVSLIDVRWVHRSWTLNRAELAYWIGANYQGKGLATEAATAVIQFAFEELRLNKIRVYHASDNPGSGRTIAKLGFRFVGEEKRAFQKNGKWHDLRHFEITEPEFNSRTKE
jgi:RimJ/RimL family protein N-acetyltransferase